MKTIDTARDLTRAVLALQAVRWARALLPLIRAQTDSEASAMLYSALCVFYARAFKGNERAHKGFGMLSSNAAPTQLKGTHDKLIRHRDKIAAHSDSDHEYDGTLVNRAYFRSDGKHLVVEDRHLSPTREFLAEVEKLLLAVETEVSDAVSKCLNLGQPSHTRYPKGLYCLDIESKQNWDFLPVQDDGLDGEPT